MEKTFLAFVLFRQHFGDGEFRSHGVGERRICFFSDFYSDGASVRWDDLLRPLLAHEKQIIGLARGSHVTILEKGAGLSHRLLSLCDSRWTHAIEYSLAGHSVYRDCARHHTCLHRSRTLPQEFKLTLFTN